MKYLGIGLKTPHLAHMRDFGLLDWVHAPYLSDCTRDAIYLHEDALTKLLAKSEWELRHLPSMVFHYVVRIRKAADVLATNHGPEILKLTKANYGEVIAQRTGREKRSTG